MLFNSPVYGLFFAAVFLSHWYLPQRFQNYVLLVASYIFYAWWDWRFLSLIIVATTVSYSAGIMLSHASLQNRRTPIAVLAIVFQLLMLGVFKYANFFADSFIEAASSIGITPSFPVLNIILPIGISFFTFQNIGYVIDTYKKPDQVERSPQRYFLFISFFPQLVAGPVERAQNIIPQLSRVRVFNSSQAYDGLHMILWGLVLKMILADGAAPYVNRVFSDPENYSGWAHAGAVVAFGFQIYGDFAGYSLVAIGSAKLVGISLMDNFRTPYFSASPREFWQRWHISLSTWFRDYVYIPIGGNRHGRTRQIFATMATFTLSGLWHGAGWNFPIWGALHGVFVSLPWPKTGLDRRADGSLIQIITQGFLIVVTFSLVSGAWIFFRADTLADAWYIVVSISKAPFSGWANIGDVTDIGRGALLAIALVLIVDWAGRRHRFSLAFLADYPLAIRGAGYYALMLIIIAFGAYSNEPFIYFKF
jgi:alginate O-acetyltransferase complex protein AlgI